MPPLEEDLPDQNDDEADDGEDGENQRDSAEVAGRSTMIEEQLVSETITGKKKQKPSM